MASDTETDSYFDEISNFYYLLNTRVAYYSEDYISLVESCTDFVAGAHDNTDFKTYTAQVNGDRVKEIKLKDLFLPHSPWKTVLYSLVWRDVYERGGFAPYYGIGVKIPDDDMQHFTLSYAGLTLYFDPYVLGCGAEGTYEITIPLTVLTDTLNPKGPAARFLELTDRK